MPIDFRPSLVAAAAVLTLGGCASLDAPVPGASAASTAARPPTAAVVPTGVAPTAPPTGTLPVPGAAGAQGPVPMGAPGALPTPPTPPGQPPAFAAVIKDAKETKGLFTIWQKEDKVWLELKPEDFDKPFFFSPKLTSGIGEGGIYGGRMFGGWRQIGRSSVVEFKRVHNQVRLVATNTDYTAKKGGPEARAVDASFSPSLLSSTVVASQAHPERKTVLIDAAPLLLGDVLGLGIELQRTYRQGYGLDTRHTSFTKTRGGDDHVTFNVLAHYASAGIAVPTPGMPTPPGAPVPTTPSTLPDVRSMFIGIHYSISKLPDTPMAARRADPRVGYFAATTQDFGDDLSRTPKQRVINRWRLEKKDPAAALSEPVKPITFWIDRTIPVKYRDAITQGIVGWNAAFEKIGFKDAVVVKVQPDNADFDTLDVNVASVRWITNAQPMFGAIGPSQVDPRTGEILDADISFESLSSRALRHLKAQVIASGGGSDAEWAKLMQLPSVTSRHAAEACEHADHAAEQLGYALDALDLDPASPEAEQFVLDYMVDVTMHEVGHTLGLRHNFRSSKIYTDQQVSDRDFTAKNGLAGSVMEYAPINLPRGRETGGMPFQKVLGPYDYWAIEYGYKPIASAQEAAELKKIAARSGEPQLAYGTDEDNFLGVDPDSLHFDLGNDPLAYARKRFDIANDLIRRQERRTLNPDEDYSVLGRSVSWALRDMARAAGILARQIGGLRTLRDFPNSGRDPLEPVEGKVQREALDVLAANLFQADSVVLSPQLQRRLAPDFFERTEAIFEGAMPSGSYSVAPAIIGLQRALLGQLMSDVVASRIIDNATKVDAKTDAPLTLSDLYGRLTKDIFSELGGRDDIAPLRRELQRDYVNRLAGQLLRPGAASRADTRSVMRAQAKALLARIESVSTGRTALSAESKAHLADSADTLKQAMDAKLQRQGV